MGVITVKRELRNKLIGRFWWIDGFGIGETAEWISGSSFIWKKFKKLQEIELLQRNKINNKRKDVYTKIITTTKLNFNVNF